MLGLKNIISPLEVDDFLENYWGKKALLIKSKGDMFDGIFGWDEINELINYSDLSAARFRLVLNKQTLHSDALKDVRNWLGQGATLVANSVQRFDPVLDRFASALGKDLNTLVNINSYTSFPSKQGFDIHFDGHDVFIIQTAGEKKWVVFEPTFTHPMERHAVNRPPAPDPEEVEPYLDCVAGPGDVIYIPRGHWHYAVAESASIHLTVGPQARSAAQFIHWIADKLSDQDDFFRKDFPIADAAEFAGNQPAGQIGLHLEDMRQRLNEYLASAELLEHLLRFCMLNSEDRRRVIQLPQVGTLNDSITPETTFRLAPDEKFLVNYDADREVGTVLFRGGMVEFTETPVDVLESLFNSPKIISGAATLAACPTVNWEPVKHVLLTLYGKGFIFLIDY